MTRARCIAAATLTAAIVSSAAATAFKGYEHQWVADFGAREAFTRTKSAKFSQVLGLPWSAPLYGKSAEERWVRWSEPGDAPRFPADTVLVWVGHDNGEGAGWASFGDLVALYGDHRLHPYEGAHAMNAIAAADLQRLQFNIRNRIDIEKFELSDLTSAKTPNWNLLHLASTNADHFTEEAVASYRQRHALALREAREAAVTGDRRHLWHAMHWEAYACHALTDLFPTGHLFIDRREQAKEMDAWYEQVLRMKSPADYLAGMPGMGSLLTEHVKAGLIHNWFNAGGARVKAIADLRRDRKEKRDADDTTGWAQSYGDGKLNVDGRYRFDVARAVEVSLIKLLGAYGTMSRVQKAKPDLVDAIYDNKAVGRDYYRALDYIPVTFKNACLDFGAAPVCFSTDRWTSLPHRGAVSARLSAAPDVNRHPWSP